ncbi:hypothetical protein H0H87_006397 [Tephrocybe sp. NHM501043]|nr:hypothetical protein H0H87_006397 [Tephrocybe sp. NHM501043]
MLSHRPRGRSRQVSHTALNRLADEQHVAVVAAPKPLTPNARPAFIPSPSTSPPSLTSSASLSPDYYDSPPSPPRTLEDQVHVAYAHDDIRLAKILLLRLKGIHVTGNDDPRIDEVKDEDFDFCFVPFGRLMDDEEEKKLKELQDKEMARVREAKRMQRLRACEKIWEQNQKRLRELRALAVRRKELEEEKRRAEEDEAAEICRQRRTSRPRSTPARPVVAYRLVAPSSSPPEERFVYDFMPLHTPVRPPSRVKPSSSKSKSPFAHPPLFDDARTVPFADVLRSMQGPLFPPDKEPRKYRHRGAALLDVLLSAVPGNDESDVKGKSKAPERPTPRRQDSATSCAACSSSTISSSRRSWLSFSSSSSSLSTAGTTPSSSPGPSASTFKPSSLRRFLSPRTTSASTSSFSTTTLDPARCPCATGRTLTRTPVSPSDAPLPVLPSVPARPRTMNRTEIEDADKHDSNAAHTVLRHLTHFVHLARGFQDAYLGAMMFAVGEGAEAAMERERQCDRALLVRVQMKLNNGSGGMALSVGMETGMGRFRTKNEPGGRACARDVRVFLSSTSTTTSTTTHFTPPPIPLQRLDEDFLTATFPFPPSTVLPSPLPYTKHIPSPPSIPQSPFRAVHGKISPKEKGGEVVLRVRNVESGVWLFVKAVEGRFRERQRGVGGKRVGGMNNSLPIPREGTMACGREKILQVACEGIGGSSLRWEAGERYPESYEDEDWAGGYQRTRGRPMQRVSSFSSSSAPAPMHAHAWMPIGGAKVQRGRAVFVGGGAHSHAHVGGGGVPRCGARMGW